jgi:hypothetical protein
LDLFFMARVNFRPTKSRLFQEPHVISAAKLRQERHLCSQHATHQPSPVGAAYSGNRNFLTGVVHSFSMSLLTELFSFLFWLLQISRS